MKKDKEKAPKKRAEKYENKLVIKGSFDNIMKVIVKDTDKQQDCE